MLEADRQASVKLQESGWAGWPFSCNPFIGWRRHAMYSTLTLSCLVHGSHSVSCAVLHSAHTRLSCADSPHSSCYLWIVPRILCFPSFPSVLEGLVALSISIRRAYSEGWELLSCETWRLGKGRKNSAVFFSIVALIATTGQKNQRLPFCSFQWSQLINS